MNLYDFLIIYLTCGAPFAVYHFLQYRSVFKSRQLWLKTILNFLFWPLSAYRFARNSRTLKNIFDKVFVNDTYSDSVSDTEKDLQITQKRIEKIVLEYDPNVSVYELREIFDRYAGLTLTRQNADTIHQTDRYKIFQIVDHDNAKLAGICFERRNRKRLSHHQTQARQDFLNIFAKLFEANFETDKLGELIVKFITLLEDPPAQKLIKEMVEQKAQSGGKINVQIARKDLWKTEPPKPSTINSNPNGLKVLTATTAVNLRGKD